MEAAYVKLVMSAIPAAVNVHNTIRHQIIRGNIILKSAQAFFPYCVCLYEGLDIITKSLFCLFV